jgi:hypothetical protein
MSPDASGRWLQASSAFAIAFDEVADVGCVLDDGGELAAGPLAAQPLTSRVPTSTALVSGHRDFDRPCGAARFTGLIQHLLCVYGRLFAPNRGFMDRRLLPCHLGDWSDREPIGVLNCYLGV